MQKHWPLITILFVFIAIVAAMLAASVVENNGHLIYALDDAYIHMAMAKNFATHGVWGITKDQFSSTSSSPLYTLLLTLTYLVFKPNIYSPLALNLVFSCLTIVFAYYYLKKSQVKPGLIAVILSAIVLLVPFPALVFFGLEHPLHVLLTLIFVTLASEVLTTETPDRSRQLMLLAVGPLLTAARYEGLFSVFIVAVLLVTRRKWRFALGLVVASIIPMVILGLISIAHGGWFFPNPIILKGTTPLDLLGHPPRLAIIAGLIPISLYSWKKDLRLFMFFTLLLLHVAFAWVGWFYRHEAYLVVLGIMAFGVWVAKDEKFKRQELVIFLILAILSLPVLLERGVWSIKRTVQATNSIYGQQYQMAMFLRQNYNTATVAANDIGAISYYTRIKLLDLAGLGSNDILREKISHKGVLSARYLANVTRKNKVDIVVIYPGWFYRRVPDRWIKAGEWKSGNSSGVLGGETIAFYALEPGQANQLKKKLRDWIIE